MHFGKQAHDKITGFTGIITGYCSYISGCSQILLTPQASEHNKYEEPRWFDEQRVTVDENAPRIELDNSATPGPDKPAPADFKPCAVCGKGVMHTGVPLFYRVEVQRFGVDLNEVRRAGAMEQLMAGNVAIARAFSDPEIAAPLTDKVVTLVCETCAMHPEPLVLLSEAR